MSHLTGQTRLLEDMAVDTCVHSSFGTVVMPLVQGFLSAPSWPTCTDLACGWALATERHTSTTDGWLTGATPVTHLSPVDVFLGGPLDNRRWQRWGAVIRLAAQFVPEDEVMRVACDDPTKQTAGTPLAGLDYDRHGAGSARQAYRTLRGLNVVLGIMHMPRTPWPGHRLSVPVGLERSLTPAQAQQLHVPYRARSQWARDLLDVIAAQLPGRPIRRLAAGGYATQDDVRPLPETAPLVGRCPSSAQLDEWPPPPPPQRRGARRQKGDLIGSPKTLAQTSEGWSPHPSATGAAFQAGCGRWHAVWPGRLMRVVVVRREANHSTKRPGQRKPPPALAAFFTTDLSWGAQDILSEYSARWAVDIELRDANAVDGLGQDQGRQRQRIMGAHTFRVVLAAARTLWFIDHVERSAGVNLRRDRPWYTQTVAPSQRDVVWACREALQEAGIFPIPRFTLELAEHHQEPDNALPLAA